MRPSATVGDRRGSASAGSSGVCAALLVLAAGAVVGGYFALQSHHDSEAIARAEAAALQAAKDCVAATQAPDTAAMIASQSKIIECSTGDFGVQAPLYSSVLAEAYQAANVKVQVSDMRAAVERHNDDGSVDVLVAVRVKVTNSEARRPGAGLPAAGADGARRRHLQDRPAGSGRVVTAVLDAMPETARRRLGAPSSRPRPGWRGPARSRWTYCWASP